MTGNTGKSESWESISMKLPFAKSPTHQGLFYCLPWWLWVLHCIMCAAGNFQFRGCGRPQSRKHSPGGHWGCIVFVCIILIEVDEWCTKKNSYLILNRSFCWVWSRDQKRSGYGKPRYSFFLLRYQFLTQMNCSKVSRFESKQKLDLLWQANTPTSRIWCLARPPPNGFLTQNPPSFPTPSVGPAERSENWWLVTQLVPPSSRNSALQ